LESNEAPCPASICKGPARGKRADGTVDVTAEQLWPGRQPEPAPLAAAEHGEACAVLAGCIGKTEAERWELLKLCLQPLHGYFWEERAVPTVDKNERWSYEARALLAIKTDCAAVEALSTPAPAGQICEEAGCWWKYVEKPTVSCQGTVATLSWQGTSFARDCSHAFAKCDAASQTGCTDRLPTGCIPGSADRCDGDVRIGCDGTGKVSFHDCSRIEGATCADPGDGRLGCVVSPGSECKPGTYSCEAEAVVLCVSGKKVSVSMTALGVSSCTAGAL
jgi:hypothetical protein